MKIPRGGMYIFFLNQKMVLWLAKGDPPLLLQENAVRTCSALCVMWPTPKAAMTPTGKGTLSSLDTA